MARIFSAAILTVLLAGPAVAAAQSVDYTRLLEQAREQAGEETLPPVDKAAPAGAVPRASALDGARSQSFEIKPVQPAGRLGVRIEPEAGTGMRPYLGADVETTRPAEGLPTPTLELGTSVPAGRDTSVSAGVRQAQPPGNGEPPPPAFRFGLDHRF
ncbi:MAG: hypothetical protein ACREUW_20845 [Burkholderiales bacterium]